MEDNSVSESSNRGYSKKLLYTLVLFFFILVALGGNLLYQQYLVSQEKKAILNQINRIEEAIQNPDKKFMTNSRISIKRIQDEQNIIIYGGDPKTIIKGRETPPDSLVGIKKTLEKDNFSTTSKKIALESLKKIFERASSYIVGEDQKTTDYFQWKKNDITKYDPNNIFIPSRTIVYPMSKIKENIAKEIIHLGYKLKK